MTDEIDHQNPDSQYARIDYWNQAYQQEYQTFLETGVAGDEWYESYQEEIVYWINVNWEEWTSHDKAASDLSVLDIGTGNGLFCHKLAGLGFGSVWGVDVEPLAVKLATELLEKSGRKNGRIRFAVDDLMSKTAVEEHANGEFRRQLEKGFSLIHDKGTLDVFVLRRNAYQAIENILRRYAQKVGTVLVVTSGNLTCQGLTKLVEAPRVANLRFKTIDHMEEPLPTLIYAGHQGQPITTMAFKVVQSVS